LGRFGWSVGRAELRSRALWRQVERGPGTVVDFTQIGPSGWDRLYIFHPYTPPGSINQALGCEWADADDGVRQGVNLVVFVRDVEVAGWFEHPRNQGELKYLASMENGYSPEHARFVVVLDSDGGLVLFPLRWGWLMIKRRVLLFFMLFISCGLTSLVTRWVVLADVQRDFGNAVRFPRYKAEFNEFVQTRQLVDGEQVNGEQLPAGLKGLGIVNVYRNGRFVYFVLAPTSFLADDATCEFFYQLDNDGSAIEDVLKTTRRYTYYIQHLNSAPRWYYWMHNWSAGN
jgi:hypothetical protein